MQPLFTHAQAALTLLLGVVLLAAPRGAHASARFEVTGSASSPDGASLEVTVDLQNQGDAKASPVTIQGELVAERREARLADGVAPGATERVVLRFPLEVPRPGLHALPLLLEWPVGPRPADGTQAPTASQRAFLLVTLGAVAEPAVRVLAPRPRAGDERHPRRSAWRAPTEGPIG